MYWHWQAAKRWPLIASSLCLLLSAVVGPESCNGAALAEEKKKEEEEKDVEEKKKEEKKKEEGEAKVGKEPGRGERRASLMDTFSWFCDIHTLGE